VFRNYTRIPGEMLTNRAGRRLFRLGFAVHRRRGIPETIAMLRALAVAGFMLVSCYAFGQSAAPRPEFVVASIKLNKSAAEN
jgi:hypothetical protein